jgi:hypothetical protein
VRLALLSVEQLINNLSAIPTGRRVYIQLDHLAVTFSQSILTLSELESLICLNDGFLHGFRWAWSEKKTVRLLPRLDSQKSSLSLIFTILQW